MTVRLDPAIIRQQIDWLFVANPELHEDEQLRADMIEGSTDAHEFLRMVERKRQDTAAMALAIELNMHDLHERHGRFKRREEAMRKLAFKIMEAADIKKIELPEATLSIRNGVPRVIITDESKLGDIACRFRREPDKAKIKELLQTGPVPGAELSNAEPTLSIRTK